MVLPALKEIEFLDDNNKRLKEPKYVIPGEGSILGDTHAKKEEFLKLVREDIETTHGLKGVIKRQTVKSLVEQARKNYYEGMVKDFLQENSLQCDKDMVSALESLIRVKPRKNYTEQLEDALNSNQPLYRRLYNALEVLSKMNFHEISILSMVVYHPPEKLEDMTGKANPTNEEMKNLYNRNLLGKDYLLLQSLRDYLNKVQGLTLSHEGIWNPPGSALKGYSTSYVFIAPILNRMQTHEFLFMKKNITHIVEENELEMGVGYFSCSNALFRDFTSKNAPLPDLADYLIRKAVYNAVKEKLGIRTDALVFSR